MRKVWAVVEQLDLAIEELNKANPINARFALILIDNSIELLLHSSCQEVMLMDIPLGISGERKYDERKRRKVLGQHFEEKAKFCREIGMLSEMEQRAILSIHSYRNELYHAGIKHNPIIQPLAWLYFEISASILPKIKRGMYEIVEPHSSRAEKYFSGDYLSVGNRDSLVQISSNLLANRPTLPDSFANLISRFAESQVVDIQGDLDFLAKNNYQKKNASQVLEDVQFYFDVFNEEEQQEALSSSRSDSTLFHQLLQTIKQDWKPKHSRNPMPRWMTRAIELRHEKNNFKVLEKYQQLRYDSSYLAEALSEAAFHLDGQIQQDVDAYRGK